MNPVTETLNNLARRAGLRVSEEYVGEDYRYVVHEDRSGRRVYEAVNNEEVAAFLGRYAQVNGHRSSER